jgi:hypothetical protein
MAPEPVGQEEQPFVQAYCWKLVLHRRERASKLGRLGKNINRAPRDDVNSNAHEDDSLPVRE